MICENCKIKIGTEKHHLFSKTKLNKKLYAEYIHDKRNIQYLCYNCHHSKPVKKHSEKEFCKVIGIETRSKTGLL